jgi:hypothetical protein
MIVSDIGSLSWMLRYEIAYNNHHRMDATVIVVRASLFAHRSRTTQASEQPRVRASGSCPDLGHVWPKPGPERQQMPRKAPGAPALTRPDLFVRNLSDRAVARYPGPRVTVSDALRGILATNRWSGHRFSSKMSRG